MTEKSPQGRRRGRQWRNPHTPLSGIPNQRAEARLPTQRECRRWAAGTKGYCVLHSINTFLGCFPF